MEGGLRGMLGSRTKTIRQEFLIESNRLVALSGQLCIRNIGLNGEKRVLDTFFGPSTHEFDSGNMVRVRTYEYRYIKGIVDSMFYECGD